MAVQGLDEVAAEVDRYVLGTGEAGADRLRILHRAYGPGTRRFLGLAGLKPGMRVADIGCGGGQVTVESSRFGRLARNFQRRLRRRDSRWPQTADRRILLRGAMPAASMRQVGNLRSVLCCAGAGWPVAVNCSGPR